MSERVPEPISVGGLAKLPLRITGTWHPYPQHWSWGGHVLCDEPLVGVLMCHQKGRLEWTRTEHRSSPDGLAVRLDYRPSDEGADVHFGVGSGQSLNWIRTRTDAKGARRPPAVEGIGSYHTGQIIDFVMLGAAEPRLLRLLLIARRDVHSKRVGLWSLRRELAMALQEPWRGMLTYGRGGVSPQVVDVA